MSDEQPYVDPNSGAAPQPGGFAGADAVEDGHGATVPIAESSVLAGDSFAQAGVEAHEIPNASGVKVTEDGVDGVEEKDDETTDQVDTGASGDDEQKAVADAVQVTQGVDLDPDADHGAGIDAGKNAGEGSLDDASDDSSDEKPAKDYSKLLEKNVPDVQKYLEKHPDEADAVRDAERAGQGRKGITGDE